MGSGARKGKVMERILTCGCGDTDKFAMDAFKLLFPLEEVPLVVHSMGVIRNKLLRTVVNGLLDGKEKYAYFILASEKSVAVWDLLKGVQIR